MHEGLRLSVRELNKLDDPIVVAAFWGWSDGTGTAMAAARYLRNEWGAMELASVDPDTFYDLTVARPVIRRRNGEATVRWPGTRFHVAHPTGSKHDVVFLVGREPSLRWQQYAELVADFITRICDASGMPRRMLSDDALAMLQVRAWPGNLRQLRNNVERMLILASGATSDPITADMLPPEASVTDPAGAFGAERIIALPLREAREVFEREYLNAQMLRFSGNISRTAAFIGMERSALHRKLKSLGLSGARALEIEEV